MYRGLPVSWKNGPPQYSFMFVHCFPLKLMTGLSSRWLRKSISLLLSSLGGSPKRLTIWARWTCASYSPSSLAGRSNKLTFSKRFHICSDQYRHLADFEMRRIQAGGRLRTRRPWQTLDPRGDVSLPTYSTLPNGSWPNHTIVQPSLPGLSLSPIEDVGFTNSLFAVSAAGWAPGGQLIHIPFQVRPGPC